MNSWLQKRRLFALLTATCVLLVANIQVVRGLIGLSSADPTESHIVLVPFVTIALLWRLRNEVSSAAEIDWLGGVPVMAAGITLVTTAGFGAHDLTTGAMGLVVSWLGMFVVLYGRRSAWLALFPLLFLLLVIPIPARLLTGAVQVLKAGSAEAVARLFDVARVPYNRDGFMFAMPGFTIEIADACSGVRSSIALMLTGFIASHLMLRTMWKKVLLIAVILPVAMLKNGVRIVGLSLLAMYVDAGFLEGRLHHEGGVVFFLLALVMMGPLLIYLRNSETILAKDN